MTTPPSFDQFYNTQGDANMTSQQSSFDQYTNNAFASGSEQFGAIYAQQLGDEPGSLGVDESAHTLHHRSSQEVLRPNFGPGDPRADVERKDSVPFDPTSSSTLIASASNTPSKSLMHQQHQYNQYDQSGQFGFTHHQPIMSPPMNDLSPQPSDMMSPPLQQDFGFQNQGFYQEAHGMNATGSTQTSDWTGTTDYLQRNGADHEADSRRASWGGSQHLGYDEQLDELQRIISNASSHAGTPAPGSRVASPFLPPEHQNLGHHTRHDSASSVARSPSPFATPSMAAPSPPIVNTTSAQGSPSFSKPQSPPALVIPNSSPSPSFPSIAASAAAAAAHQPPHGSQFGNSLLPPVNPALEHLTGMAGISPIAPNADGPMITIQPSTPISGMKDHAGVFDAALRRASANWQQQNQQAQHAVTQQQQPGRQQSPQPQSNGMSSGSMGQQQPPVQDNSVFVSDSQWNGADFGLAVDQGQLRGRSKSESYMMDGGAFDRQAAQQLMGGPMGQFADHFPQQQQQQPQSMHTDPWVGVDINAWRVNQARETGMTMDPRQLTGNESVQLQDELRSIEAQQRARLQQIQTQPSGSGAFKYEPLEQGQISPTSAAFYAQLAAHPPAYTGLMAPNPGLGPRRKSFTEGIHPAAGAGTPGYGNALQMPGAITPPGRLRGGSFNMGHRRQVQSEDFSRGGQFGTGWGVGQGGSTAAFMQAMTNPNDGTLLPPMNRGRSMSHSRHSSVSSNRSPSPALSISSQGSSFSHHSHMEMPDGVPSELFAAAGGDPNSRGVAKMKVTSMATEVASQSRRTNSGIFKCPVPGCNSTFTRHFNLKGHLRSHNDERPYKCLYDGCPKAIVGFARQHDCKRHMLLHEGLRPFECGGCGKTFARLDALTRHHKSEQGQECAISHPLPTNPDGSAMSESQYKAYRLQQMKDRGGMSGAGSSRGGRSGGASADVSADERDFMDNLKSEG